MINLLFLASIVLQTKQIQFENFPRAFNPSIHEFGPNYLLTFRYHPDPEKTWISHIVAAILDENLDPITEPQIVNPPSKSEDARIFSYRNRLFLIYNDNFDSTPDYGARRYMVISELFFEHGRFFLSTPLKLNYREKENASWWEKNWVPFVCNHQLYLIYSINPHEIIIPNFIDGCCYRFNSTRSQIDWAFGPLRSSAPPQLIDGQYLTFFHSSMVTATPASDYENLWHYYMGAYTFNSQPPFNMTKISPEPIIADGFYTPSDSIKRVIFPGGFVISQDKIYLAYGKDDCEMWIATLDKTQLLNSLIEVKSE